jgi:preprotein translocase subunit SecF
LVRSINTSAVALLPVLSILVVGVSLLGVGTLNDLALALFVGMLVGTYSSIFVATPFLCQLKERTPENIALAKRVNARRKTGDVSEDIKPVVSIGAPIVSSAGPRQQQVKKPRSRRSGK